MPMGKYKDFADCVAQNQDKDDPKAYCGKIQAAIEGKALEHPEIEQTRMLDITIPIENFTRMKNGALKVTNIVALAEGTWTDSAVKTPLYYPPRVLERDAGNWLAQGIWVRHQGGLPRPITDRVGTIKDPRYDVEKKAVVVDGIFHGRSQASRDVIDLIEDGIITDVSAEVGGKEIWNAETKRYEAASLAFIGMATVDRGACKVCKMPRRNEAEELEIRAEEERKAMETKELEQKVAALETEKVELAKKVELEKAELTKQLEAVSKSKTDEESAHKTVVEELTKKLSEADARIRELEKAPKPPKTIPGNGESTQKELECATPVRIVDGEVSRV